MHILKYTVRIFATDFCRPDVLAAEQCLSTACERPNPPCYPYYPCPVYEKPCVPSEAACQVLREIEILLRGFTPSLLTQINKELQSEFNDLLNNLLSADLRSDNEIIALTQQLEADILTLIDNRFRELGFSLTTTIKADFAKSRTTGNSALTSAKADISAAIATLSNLTDAEILANLQDTANGFQATALAAANSVAAAVTASYVKQEKDILAKIAQGIANEKALINAAIAKLFKDYEKAVKALDTAYALAAKKYIDNAKAHSENALSQIITEFTRKDGLIAVSLLRRLIEKITNCDYVESGIPLGLLVQQPPFAASQPVVY